MNAKRPDLGASRRTTPVALPVCAFSTARAGIGPALDREVPELAGFAQARRPAIDARACRGIVLRTA